MFKTNPVLTFKEEPDPVAERDWRKALPILAIIVTMVITTWMH